MRSTLLLSTIIIAALYGCKTTSGTEDSNLESRRNGPGDLRRNAPTTFRFFCKYNTDKVSKDFRPKKMTDKLETMITAKTVNDARIEISIKGTVPEIEDLKPIGGDEGYTEFKVPKVISDKYGFDYVHVKYDGSKENPSPLSAVLVNEGEFATCKAEKTKS